MKQTDKLTGRAITATVFCLLVAVSLILVKGSTMSTKTNNKKSVANVAGQSAPFDMKAFQAGQARIEAAKAKVEAAKAELDKEQSALRELLAPFNAVANSLGVSSVRPVSGQVSAVRGSQKQAVIDLLLAGPISCKEIAAKVGTSEHNIQGTLTGIRRGTEITAEKINGVTVYSLPKSA